MLPTCLVTLFAATSLLTLVTSLPTHPRHSTSNDQTPLPDALPPFQRAYTIGQTTMRNAELISLVETANREGKVPGFFCNMVPHSAWDGARDRKEDVGGGVEDECVLIKAKTTVRVCCYDDSFMVVSNSGNADVCLDYDEPPSREDMKGMCTGFKSYGWMKNNLWYQVMCEGFELGYHEGPKALGP